MADLETVIEDSLTDAELKPDTIAAESEAPVDTVEAAGEKPEGAQTEPAQQDLALEVPSPAAKASPAKSEAPTEEDDFAKKHGLQPQRPGERENRIPYSAVKRIVGNAEKKAVAAALEPVTKELTDFKTKVTDYEGRLGKVAQFEQVMLNDPSSFLNMLAKIPAYRQIFEGLVPKGAAAEAPAPAPADPLSDMPQPDQALADGTKVYSMDGLKALFQWNEKQVEARVADQLGKRIAPLEQQRQEFERQRQYSAWQHQQVQQVNAQIEEARKWPQFNENEAEITKALAENPSFTLERAYQHVILPKLTQSYNDQRSRILAELKKAPQATSTGASPTRPAAQVGPSGKRDLESIIRESIKGLGE